MALARTGSVEYLVRADPCLCQCDSPRSILSRHRKLELAIASATGHWSLYTTFFGHMTHWLDFVVVDARDGVIEWKNGQPTRGEKNALESAGKDYFAGLRGTGGTGRYL